MPPVGSLRAVVAEVLDRFVQPPIAVRRAPVRVLPIIRLRAGCSGIDLLEATGERVGRSDSRALGLVARHRAGEIDAAYAAYDRVPLDADDEWGNLASFRTAAGAS